MRCHTSAVTTPSRWTVLGSGTLEFQAQRGPSCHLLETGEARILVDSGPGCLQRLAERGLTGHDLDAVVHSHLHLDHLADLFPLLFHGAIEDRDRPLLLAGAPGHRDRITAMAQTLYSKLMRLPLAWSEQPPDRVLRPLGALGIQLGAWPAEHSQHPRLLRFEGPDWSLVYTGDTGPTDALAAAAEGVDWLVAECTAPDGIPRGRHLSPSSIADAVRAARPKAVALVHLSPLWADPQDAARAVAKQLGGLAIPVIGATDGLGLPLPYSHSMVPGGLLEMS